MSVRYDIPPPTYPPGGEIGSPVFMPGGQVSVRTPHRRVIERPPKFELQTWSLPSITIAHEPHAPPPLYGEPGPGAPSGRSMEMLPMRPFASASNAT